MKRFIVSSLMIFPMLSAMPVLADFSDSPTNYLPAYSDVIVCNSGDGSLSIVNGTTGDTIRTIQLPPGAEPLGVSFSPDYKSAYVTGGGTGDVYLIRQNRVRKVIHTPSSGVTSITIHPKGQFAYVTSLDGVLILDTRQNAIVGTVAGVEFADSIVFTPDGTRAYLSEAGNYGSVSQVHVVDATSHSLIETIQLPISTAPLGVAATPDGSRVYVAGWVAHNVSVIDSELSSPTYNTVTSVIPVSGEARGIALSPSGNLAYVTLDTGGVDAIVTAPASSQFHQVIAHIPDAGAFGGIHGAATSLDGRFLYVSVSDGTNNKLFTVDSEPFSSTFNSLITTFQAGKSPLGIAVRPH